MADGHLAHVQAEGHAWRSALALAGLAAVGSGAAILLGILEGTPMAGALLLVVGLGAFGAARGVPGTLRLAPEAVAATGVVLVVGIILHGALLAAPFDVRRVALALIGVAMQVAAPFLDRQVSVRAGGGYGVASLVAGTLALVATPLVLWMLLAGL